MPNFAAPMIMATESRYLMLEDEAAETTTGICTLRNVGIFATALHYGLYFVLQWVIKNARLFICIKFDKIFETEI